MAKLTIVKDLCKGCGLCADVCPKGLLALSKHINARGYHLIAIEEQEKCIGCGACENLCPARPFSAIYVEGHEVHRTV